MVIKGKADFGGTRGNFATYQILRVSRSLSITSITISARSLITRSPFGDGWYVEVCCVLEDHFGMRDERQPRAISKVMKI